MTGTGGERDTEAYNVVVHVTGPSDAWAQSPLEISATAEGVNDINALSCGDR